jgi:multidrug efflux pump subunit AcrB
MMCSRLLRHGSAEPARGGIVRQFHRLIDGSVELYRSSLEWVLRHETLTLLVTAATLVATVWLYIIIPKGFPAAAGHRPHRRGDGGRDRRSRSPR